MSLALYRKYRPRTFAEVIGQDQVTEPLTQALRAGRLHHAYLFSGPRGCGKTSSARILARSLNCEKGPTPDPCGECPSCVALAPDGPGSIDVIEIDAASHGGVDDARELRERAFFAPVSSRFKVYVIDEAHMVSTQGFNALLKLVEEPPEYVMFVFATTEPEKVLGTIRSRTHHYPFRLVPPGVLRPYLEKLCRQEGVAVEPAALPLVVRAGGGSVRDSLSVLDQLIAGAGPAGVTYARALALLGVTDVALIDEMCDALAAEDGSAAFGVVDRLVDAGHDPRRFAGDLLERLRDLIIIQRVPDAAAKGLIDAPDDQMERMTAQARRFGPAALSRCADLIHGGLTEMRGATAPRLLLELVVARMLLPGADDGSSALLHRLERMERRLTVAGDPGAQPPAAPTDPPGAAGSPRAQTPRAAEGGSPRTAGRSHPVATPAAPSAPSAPAAPARPEPARPGPATEGGAATPVPRAGGADRARPADPAATAPAATAQAASAQGSTAPAATAQATTAVAGAGGAEAPTGAAQAAPGAIDAAGVRRVWDEILTLVGRRSKRAAAVVREATVREVEGDVLVLLFRHQVHADMLTASPNLLVEAVHEVLGGVWRLRCEHPGSGGSAPVVGGAAAEDRSRPAARGRTAPTGRTGGSRAGTPAARTAPAPAADTEDWPVTARPGGATAPPSAATSAPPAPATTSPAATSPAATPVTSPPAAATSARSAAPAPAGSGSRSWPAGGPVERPQRGARPPGRAPGTGGGSSPSARGAEAGWADAPPPDEPPYDPDYDGAPPPAAYEGFDPGDEPTDDVVDERTARQSSEQQAMDLLRQHLGAEKIGEIGA